MSSSKENLPVEGHNASPQAGVDKKSSDEAVYSTGTTEKGHDVMDSPPQDYTHHKMSDAGVKSVDEESGNVGQTEDEDEANKKTFKSQFKQFYRRFRIVFHLFIWGVWTAWWIVGLIYHRSEPAPASGWLVAFLVYLAITLRIIFLWIPIALVMKPVKFVWDNTAKRGYDATPKRLHQPLAAAVTVAVFLIGSFVPEENGENTRVNRLVSIFGLAVMMAGLWLTSRDRKRIPWHTVIGGMLTQFIIAVFVLRTQVGYDIFHFIAVLAGTLLGFAKEGTTFLTDSEVPSNGWFLTGVIPPIVFFVSLVALAFHSGLLQWFIGKFAHFFFWTLRVSGAEAVVASATPFIGQGESAMLIRPFIPHLTLAEIHQVMCCGFATIAGSVLMVYIEMGLPAQALVSSCIMSIPASLAISKMRYPESEETLTSGRIVVPEDEGHKAANALHAFANGAWLGLKIAGMIVATLLCIIAFIGLINGLLTWWGQYWGITGLTLQLILGYVMYPVAWLLGVPKQDLRAVGQIIGIKIVANEFVAFSDLIEQTQLLERSRVIATYACCGFGNIGSLGNQIGVLAQIAPGRSGDVSRVAVSALISGIIATLSSASIAGMLYTEAISG